MKIMRRLCLLFTIVLLFNCGYVWAAPAVDSCMTLDAQVALAGNSQLLPTAQAAVLYALDSDTMVYSWNPDVQLDPSGMNKIMTALIALENGNPDALVTVSTVALNSVEIGALSVGLRSGEAMSLRDLLYLMMVGSANDAAAVIAEHISGSQAAFVDRMNQRAVELGCDNTNFVNPTGLSAQGQYSTARDLAKITAEALKLEPFVELFSAVEYTVSASDTTSEYKVSTTNHMMSDAVIHDQLDNRVTGGKTGALSSTDRSLISKAEQDGQRYLVVVMSAKGTTVPGSTSIRTYGNFEETKLLLDHGFSQFTQRQLLSGNKVMAQFQVMGGENDLAVSSRQAVSALMPKDMKTDRVSYRCVQAAGGLTAPIAAGETVGTVQLWYDNMCVAQGDLIAMHNVKEKGTAAIVLQPQAKVGNGSLGTLLLVCMLVFFGAVVLVVGIVVSIRNTHTDRYRRRRKKQRRR